MVHVHVSCKLAVSALCACLLPLHSLKCLLAHDHSYVCHCSQCLSRYDNTMLAICTQATFQADGVVAVASGVESEERCWEALLAAWQPYRMGWKDLWWRCVACPPDVDNEQSFRQGTQIPAVRHGLTLLITTQKLTGAEQSIACSQGSHYRLLLCLAVTLVCCMPCRSANAQASCHCSPLENRF